MNKNDSSCKHILCIRPDNMGDIVMTSPALRALKESFAANITLLTSSMGAPIAPFIECIDEVLVFDLPWVSNPADHTHSLHQCIEVLRSKHFDMAVIFTVYSQNPLPAAMLAYLSGIPQRVAYCRENPYGLLTHWLPDKEPLSYIQHQVLRDCQLVESIGAQIKNSLLQLRLPVENKAALELHLEQLHVKHPYIVLHTMVSEQKRRYPDNEWIKIARAIFDKTGFTIILTGSKSEASQTEKLAKEIGEFAVSAAGYLSMAEFILLIKQAPLIITVNTVAMHIAAAVKTPIVALYALTNPQHYPWGAKGKVFPYKIHDILLSKNELIRFVSANYHPEAEYVIPHEDVVNACTNILQGKRLDDISEPLLKLVARPV